MKITATQLRRIIKEEVENITEAADLGSALAAGSLAGVGRGKIEAALLALSDADFEKFRLAFDSVSGKKRASAATKKRDALAAAFDPATLASKIQKSLSSGNWTWAGYDRSGQPDMRKREAVVAAVEAALPGTGYEFEDALVTAAGDSDVFRGMSDAQADKKYKSALSKLMNLVPKLQKA